MRITCTPINEPDDPNEYCFLEIGKDTICFGTNNDDGFRIGVTPNELEWFMVYIDKLPTTKLCAMVRILESAMSIRAAKPDLYSLLLV